MYVTMYVCMYYVCMYTCMYSMYLCMYVCMYNYWFVSPWLADIPTQFNWLPCQPPDLTAHSKTMNIIKEQQLLLLWGMSVDGNPCDDSWVLHTNTMTWEKVNRRIDGWIDR